MTTRGINGAIEAYSELVRSGFPQTVPSNPEELEQQLYTAAATHPDAVHVVKDFVQARGLAALQDIIARYGSAGYATQNASARGDYVAKMGAGTAPASAGAMGIDPSALHAKLEEAQAKKRWNLATELEGRGDLAGAAQLINEVRLDSRGAPTDDYEAHARYARLLKTKIESYQAAEATGPLSLGVGPAGLQIDSGYVRDLGEIARAYLDLQRVLGRSQASQAAGANAAAFGKEAVVGQAWATMEAKAFMARLQTGAVGRMMQAQRQRLIASGRLLADDPRAKVPFSTTGRFVEAVQHEVEPLHQQLRAAGKSDDEICMLWQQWLMKSALGGGAPAVQ